MKNKLSLRRVDVQVVLLTTSIVIFSCVLLNFIMYNLAYNNMIQSLKERTDSIVEYVESNSFDITTFYNINTKEDIQKEAYRETKKMFSNIREVTNAQYLYTAKLNDNGEMIYVIDGLPMESYDFRYPGELIEPDFQEGLNKALRGEIVLPETIMNTEWGSVFVAYYPIHNINDEIVGAIGVEFPANSQYETYTNIRRVTPIIIAISCIISALFSIAYFRRISNPRHKDLSNTDYLTLLKSRNAFEVDIQNRLVQKLTKNLGVIIFDLNGLKYINDNLGHDRGDEYLKSFSNAMLSISKSEQIAYRIGGDEFLLLVENATVEKCSLLIEHIDKKFKELSSKQFDNPSFAYGYSICVGNTKEQWTHAKIEADENMYTNKKEHYCHKMGSSL